MCFLCRHTQQGDSGCSRFALPEVQSAGECGPARTWTKPNIVSTPVVLVLEKQLLLSAAAFPSANSTNRI